MSKSLTLTITDIPDDIYKEYWKDQKELSLKECGVPVEETDHVTVSAKLLLKYYPDEFCDTLGYIGTACVITSADKILNDDKEGDIR